MEKLKNAENEAEVVETEEVTEKVGFVKRGVTKIKKNAKKIAVVAGTGVLGLIVGYNLGKNSADEDYYEDNDGIVEATYETDEETE